MTKVWTTSLMLVHRPVLSFIAQKPTTTVLIHGQGQHACVAGLRRTDRIFFRLRFHFLPSRRKTQVVCRSSVLLKLFPDCVSGLQIQGNRPTMLDYMRPGLMISVSTQRESCGDVTGDLERKMGGNQRGKPFSWRMSRSNLWIKRVHFMKVKESSEVLLCFDCQNDWEQVMM